MIICPKCFERLPDQSRFCGKCKINLATVQDELKTCTNCGSKIPNILDHCPICGKPFSLSNEPVITTSTLQITRQRFNPYKTAFFEIGKISLLSFTGLLVLALLGVILILGLHLRSNMMAQLFIFSVILVLSLGGMHFLYGLSLLQKQGKYTFTLQELTKEALVFFGIIFLASILGVFQMILVMIAPILFFTGFITIETGVLFALAQFINKHVIPPSS